MTGRRTEILVVGTSFKTAPISTRESLVRRLSAQGRLGALRGVAEHAALLTCNRAELYFATDDPEGTKAAFFDSVKDADGCSDTKRFYALSGREAVKHLYRVASGLDSMLLGEEQIYGQVRKAESEARKAGDAKAVLSALFDSALGVARSIRKGSRPGRRDRSIGVYAVRFAKRRMKVRKDTRVLLVGTGKTIMMASRELGVPGSQVYIATRRSQVPEGMEEAHLVPYSELGRVADSCDLIIAATSHPDYLIRKEDLSPGRRRLLIDLAVPRNVEPSVSSGAELYNLDDLGKEFMHMSGFSRGRLDAAEATFDAEAARFEIWLTATRLSPALSGLYSWAEGLRAEELERAKKRLLGGNGKAMEIMSRRLVSRLLYPPTNFAKSASDGNEQARRLDLLERVFGLDVKK
ncbi:MAG: glutamyl-tRNA reductase [Nitrososphaerota archaeon]|nr:glutamyl-tRNA reductase [Nitrososphaerota archaeon]